MKINHFLLCILWISLFICQPTLQAEAPQTQVNQPLAIKFHRPSLDAGFSFPMQFTLENVTIPVLISTYPNGLWISGSSYSASSGHAYSCSKSKSCHDSASLDLLWGSGFGPKEYLGTVVKERVSFEGLDLPDFSVFVINSMQVGRWSYTETSSQLGLGLGIEETNSNILDQLKAKKLIQKSIFSISLGNDTDGELVLGGYPSQKTRSDFEFTDLGQDQFGRLTVYIQNFDFRSHVNRALYNVKAVIDFEHNVLSLPRWQYDRINDKIDSKGLRLHPPFASGIPERGRAGEVAVNCKALTVMEDLAIQLELATLYIPASAYIRYGKGEIDGKESSENGCFLAVDNNIVGEQEFIIGQPLLRAYDIVYDFEKKVIGFSAKDPSNQSSRGSFLTYVVLVVIALGLSAHFFMKKTRGNYVPFSGKEVNISEAEPRSGSELVNVDLAVSKLEEEGEI